MTSDVSPAPTPRTEAGKRLLDGHYPSGVPFKEEMRAFLRRSIVAIEVEAESLGVSDRAALHDIVQAAVGAYEGEPYTHTFRAAAAPLEPPRPDPEKGDGWDWECGVGNGPLVCGRPMGHKGMHRRRTPLADSGTAQPPLDRGVLFAAIEEVTEEWDDDNAEPSVIFAGSQYDLRERIAEAYGRLAAPGEAERP